MAHLPGLRRADLLAVLHARIALPRPLQDRLARRRAGARARSRTLLPARLSARVNFRVGALPRGAGVADRRCWRVILGVVYDQQGALHAGAQSRAARALPQGLRAALAGGRGGRLVDGAGQREPPAWRRTNRTARTSCCTREIEAHQRTDAALQARQGPGRGRQPGQDALRRRHDARAAHAAEQHPRLRADPAEGRADARRRARAAVDTIHRSGEHLHGADRRPARPGAHRGRPAAAGPGAAAAARVPRRPGAHGRAAGRGQGPGLRAADRGPRAGLRARRRQAAAPDPASTCWATRCASPTAAASRCGWTTAARWRASRSSTPASASPRRTWSASSCPSSAAAPGGARGEPGTGLGLTITHLLTQLMGGELTVQQRARRGQHLHRAPVPQRDRARRRRARGVTHAAGHRLHRRAPHAAGGRRPADAAADAGRHAAAAGLSTSARRPAARECLESVLERAARRRAARHHDGRHGRLGDRAPHPRRGLRRRCRSSWSRPTPSRTRPDKLAAAGCQGFVDKPVIESELLRRAAARTCSSSGWPSWRCRAGRRPARAGAPLRAAAEEHARTLIARWRGWATRRACATALRPAGRRSTRRCAAQAAALRVLVDRFAWNELLEQLASAVSADERGGTRCERRRATSCWSSTTCPQSLGALCQRARGRGLHRAGGARRRGGAGSGSTW